MVINKKEEIFMGDRVSKTMEAVAQLFYSLDDQHSFDGQDKFSINSNVNYGFSPYIGNLG